MKHSLLLFSLLIITFSVSAQTDKDPGKSAETKLKRHNYSGALEDFNTAIAEHPDNYVYYSERGECKNGLRRYADAMADFDKAISLNPNYANAYADRGNSKRLSNQYSEAMADLEKAIFIDPNNEQAYMFRALAQVTHRDFNAGISDYTKVIELDSTNVEAYFARAHVYGTIGLSAQSIADYNKAIAINPRYLDGYIFRGEEIGKGRLGNNPADGLPDLNYAIAKNPKNYTPYAYRARIEAALKKYNEAVLDLDTALRLRTDLLGLIETRGMYKIELERYADAISDFTAVLAADASRAAVYNFRGYCYYKVGGSKIYYENAIADYDRGAKMGIGKWVKTYDYRAAAVEELGK